MCSFNYLDVQFFISLMLFKGLILWGTPVETEHAYQWGGVGSEFTFVSKVLVYNFTIRFVKATSHIQAAHFRLTVNFLCLELLNYSLYEERQFYCHRLAQTPIQV